MSYMCYYGDIFEVANDTASDVLYKVKKASVNNMIGLVRYLILLPIGFCTLWDFNKLAKRLKRITNHSCILVDNVRTFHSDLSECIDRMNKLKNKWKRLSHTAPFWNKIYYKIIEIIKLFEKMEKMPIKPISNEMEAVSVFEKRITSNPIPMIVSMSIYSFLVAVVIYLVILKVVPISGGVIGCILGVSFFLTALSDFNHRGQKHC